jgi:hypothetical protein
VNQPWLNSCLLRHLNTTRAEAGALTVAGQWRNFTAFPSILTIAVVDCAASSIGQPVCHGTIFHDINFIAGSSHKVKIPSKWIEYLPSLFRHSQNRTGFEGKGVA